jgi:ElaB/YqjD/DUF883 family membrane-anchored ribosome-binding protein
MEAKALDRATDLSSAAALFEAGVGQVKEAVADAVEDGIATTKRSLRQGQEAAEDLLDGAKHYVKRHPLSTAGTALGIGLGLGVVIGFLLRLTLSSGR